MDMHYIKIWHKLMNTIENERGQESKLDMQQKS